MMTVRNTNDLRVAYELLGIYIEVGRDEDPKAVEVKQQIRAFTNRPAPASVIVRDDGMDGYVALQRLPDFTDGYTLDEAREYFQEAEVIEPAYSAYDCTGRPFTSWFKVFQRRGHWYAYHSVGFDV